MTAAEHTLVRDGAAHFANTSRTRVYVRPGVDAFGRAACSCGRWLSEPLPTTQARRQAHAQHVVREAARTPETWRRLMRDLSDEPDSAHAQHVTEEARP